MNCKSSVNAFDHRLPVGSALAFVYELAKAKRISTPEFRCLETAIAPIAFAEYENRIAVRARDKEPDL